MQYSASPEVSVMATPSLLSLFFILAGAVIMAVSLRISLNSHKFLNDFKRSETKNLRWYKRLNHVLMAFFLFGYLTVAIAILMQTDIISTLFVGFIFFFGAIFVFLTLRLQKKMNSMLQDRYAVADKALNALKNERMELLKSNERLATEIRERQEAEQRVRENEARLQQIVSTLPIGIFIIDATTLQIVEVNPTAQNMIGAPRDNIINQHCQAVICTTDRGHCPVIGKTEHSYYQNEHILTTADGLSLPILKTVTTIYLEGKQHFLEALLDISDKKKLEEQLKRTEKMELLGTLAGGVAHDLNNILSGLKSYPELLLLNIEANDPLRPPLETIQRSGEKAAAIVQDLLTLARQNINVKETVDFEQILQSFFASPEFSHIQSRHPNVSFHFSSGRQACFLKASPVHLEKIVMNLVGNGAEAISSEGTVEVKLNTVQLDHPPAVEPTCPAGEYVVLTVSDDGAGMPPNDLDKIYEPFFTNKVMGHSGSGLGMTVVWNTVKDHGGFIEAESSPGKGTSFRLFFPTAPSPLPVDSRQSSHVLWKGSGQTVLVVDDVKEQREIATSMLQHLGYSVDLAESGEEALSLLNGRDFDLILLDMLMAPGIDGLETYRHIFALRPTQKILFVSGYTDNDRIIEMADLGLTMQLKKPYSLPDLAESVQTALMGGKHLPSTLQTKEEPR